MATCRESHLTAHGLDLSYVCILESMAFSFLYSTYLQEEYSLNSAKIWCKIERKLGFHGTQLPWPLFNFMVGNRNKFLGSYFQQSSPKNMSFQAPFK